MFIFDLFVCGEIMLARKWYIFLFILPIIAGCKPNIVTQSINLPTQSVVTLSPHNSPTQTVTKVYPTFTSTPPTSPTQILTPENTPIPSTAPFSINDFHMVDADNGFVVGFAFGYGTSLYKTNALAKDWTFLFRADPDIGTTNKSTKKMIMDVVGSKNIWLMMELDSSDNLEEANVKYSNDGGLTFNKSEPLPISMTYKTIEPVQLFFLNSRIGWLLTVVTNSQNKQYIHFFHTTDGGINWEHIYQSPAKISCGHHWQKKYFYFVDEYNGYFSGICSLPGEEVIFTNSNDGGKTWKTDNAFAFTREFSKRYNATCIPSDFYQDFDQILHVNITCFNVSGYSQTYSFSRVKDSNEWVNIVSKFDRFYLTKGNVFEPRTGYVSYNGGKDWKRSFYSNNDPIENIKPVTDQLLFALVCDGIPCWMMKSLNGGKTWQRFPPFIE